VIKPDWESNSSQVAQRKAQMAAQVKILQLQKELEKERERLGIINKKEYADADVDISKTQAMAKQQEKSAAQAAAAAAPLPPPIATSPQQKSATKAAAKPAQPPVKASSTPPTKSTNANANPSAADSPNPNSNTNTNANANIQRRGSVTSGAALPPPVKISSAPGTVRKTTQPPAPIFYTLEELQNRPSGVDTSQLENYLTDEDFQKLFGMDRASFAATPQWKRNSEKKKHNLY